MTRILVVGAVLLCAWRVEASCQRLDVYNCWCGIGPAELAETVSIEADGGATARSEDGGVRYYAALEGEVAGSRSFIVDRSRELVGADGKVACAFGYELSISATVARHAASLDQVECRSFLADAGVAQVRQPPCNDNPGCSTAVAPVSFVCLLLGMLWRRRRGVAM